MKRKMEKEATTGSEQLGARSRGSEQQMRRREEEVRGRRGHDDGAAEKKASGRGKSCVEKSPSPGQYKSTNCRRSERRHLN